MTVSGHFIDQNWQMWACSFETVHVAVQHTADNLSELLTKISDDSGISSKVHDIITDDGANMVSAVRENPLETHSVVFTHLELSCEGLKADVWSLSWRICGAVFH